MRRLATACVLLPCLAGPVSADPSSADPSCFETLARTREFGLGQPRSAVPEPDGAHALYLRSGPRDTALSLFEYDLAAGTERKLAGPDAEPQVLSAEEKARRERMRMTLSGITDFAMSRDGGRVLLTDGQSLSVLALPSGETARLPGAGWIAPRLSPDGAYAAAVRDDDLHVIDLTSGADMQLTQGGSETLTRGLAEFAAAEELDRADGVWWAPDGARLLYEEADASDVERHWIADPGHPATPPVGFRYPRAGTANARVRLGVIARAGGPTTWLDWDRDAFPYVARVVWPERGRLSVVVLDRLQKHERLLAADPDTGRTTTLLEETDAAWINLAPSYAPGGAGGPELPHWMKDGSGFLWAAERGAQWRLELRRADGSLDHPVTPDGWRFAALDDVDEAAGEAVVTGGEDRMSEAVYRVKLAGGAPAPVAAEPGLHHARFADGAHALFADARSLADGTAGTALRRADGGVIATLPSAAEAPARVPDVQYLTAGPRALDAMVVRPSDFVGGQRYPVVLSVYAGPGVKVVRRAPRLALADQCLADHGFIVVSLDGRGTPGRDHDFERSTSGDLIDAPLDDQIEGLRALAGIVPEMDLSRVGVSGWSFGGYFAAMATIRRPDVFAAGVAGAPVVDFADYDTAYTERYLGLPRDAPRAYEAADVETYAAGLSRPLLILHGMTDDNVYFQNSFKLTQALLAAGKPYSLILLPGTHQLPDPVLRMRVDEAGSDFLADRLGAR